MTHPVISKMDGRSVLEVSINDLVRVACAYCATKYAANLQLQSFDSLTWHSLPVCCVLALEMLPVLITV